MPDSYLKVEKLKKSVTEAEHARTKGSHPLVSSIYNIWLGHGNTTEMQLGSLGSNSSSFNPEIDTFNSISDFELMAIGLLGLQRSMLVSAVSEYKQNTTFTKAELITIVERYKQVFTLLLFAERFPYSIHGDFPDWVGEYYQDLVMAAEAMGNDVNSLLQKAFSVLNKRLDDAESDDHKAAILSSKSVLQMRKARVERSISELLVGADMYRNAHQLAPNPQRKKDLGKMILKESKKNVLKTNPFKTIKAVMVGAEFLLQK